MRWILSFYLFTSLIMPEVVDAQSREIDQARLRSMYPALAASSEDEVLLSRGTLKIEKRVGFLDKTSKELNTPEGKAIATVVTAVAAYFGVPPNYIAVGTTLNSAYQDKRKSSKEEQYIGV